MNQAIEGDQPGQPVPEQSWGQVVTDRLQRMQELIGRERTMRGYLGDVEEAKALRAQIEGAADDIVRVYREQPWTSFDRLLRIMVPTSAYHQVDSEIFKAKKRKQEEETARRLLQDT